LRCGNEGSFDSMLPEPDLMLLEPEFDAIAYINAIVI
jgi:hypothetical protein